MALTVIPAVAAGLLSANAASTGAAGEAIAGAFAALLSDELSALQGGIGDAVKDLRQDLTSERGKSEGEGGVGATSESVADPSLFASLFGHYDSRPATGAVRTAPAETDAGGVAGIVSQPRAYGRETEIEVTGQGRPAAPRTSEETNAASSERPPLPITATAAAVAATSADKNASPVIFGSQLAASLRPAAANIAGDKPGGDTPPTLDIPPAPPHANPPANGLEKVATGDARPAVSAHLHSAAWPQQFGDKLVWLARNEQQTAQLTINPPQLGPVQITLNLSGDQASIAFASPHAEVRQAIESAMPQLKEMLSSAGINLGQSNVGANLSQQMADNPFADANGKRSADENAILPANDKAANAAGNPVLHRGRGLVDLFA